MRRYETIVVLNPDVVEPDAETIFERLKNVISQYNGRIVFWDDWGQKKLAYPIKGKERARYVRIDYCGMGDLVAELERLIRIDDRFLKYMTVLLKKKINNEEIEREIIELEAKKVQAMQAAQAAAAEISAKENADKKVVESSDDDDDSDSDKMSVDDFNGDDDSDKDKEEDQ
jgi:small subunit ribosomal protein S6